MPRFKKSVFFLCIIFCLAGERQKQSISADQVTSPLINKEGPIQIDTWSKTLKAYDKALLNFIGNRALEEIEIKKDENYVRFRRSLPYSQCQIVIEVIDNNNSLPIIKWAKVQLNPACHPMFSLPYNNPVCFKLIYFHQKTISQIEVDILMNSLAEQEFWELSPNESPIRGSKNLAYDGEQWNIEAKTSYYDWSIDSSSSISHSVSRSQVLSFESFYKIGSHIQGMVEDKYIFP